MRSRYYAPGTGRFLTKDPSGVEANLYLYASANPINRVDPTGLFSRDQIAKSFGFNAFSDVLNYYDRHGEHWGFLAALFRALPGDYLISEQVRIEPFTQPYKRAKTFYVGYDSSQGVTLDGIPLRMSFSSNGPGNPTQGILSNAGTPWRSADATYYMVADYSGREQYIDGGYTSDLPDFWAASFSISPAPVPLGGQVMKLVDRFGQSYYSAGVIAGVGSPVGLAYSEGYMGIPAQSGTAHIFRTVKSPAEMLTRIRGFNNCFSMQGSFLYGVSLSMCLNQSFVSIFSVGFQGGAGGSLPYLPPMFSWKSGSMNPKDGWQWAIDQRATGIMRGDLANIWSVPYDGCSEHIPLQVR
jgi:hypothetical protein